MMRRPKRFWMVHGDGTGPTNHRHDSHAAAKDEARRLARKCPDTVFYVLEATSAHVKVDVQDMQMANSPRSVLHAEVDDDDDIPF